MLRTGPQYRLFSSAAESRLLWLYAPYPVVWDVGKGNRGWDVTSACLGCLCAQVLARCHRERPWGGIPTVCNASPETKANGVMNPTRAVTPVGGGDTPGSDVASVGSSVMALLANLLPQANTDLFTGAQGIYVREGLPPVRHGSPSHNIEAAVLYWCWLDQGSRHCA